MRTFAARMDVLPVAQRSLWPQLAGAPGLGFVLYGGTAVALQLGHRASVDFDFFRNDPLDRVVMANAFPFMADATVIQDEPNTLSLLVPIRPGTFSIKLSFFGALRFGRVGEPAWSEDRILQVASLDDLMAHKLKVILQRAEAKDYRDIAAMLAHGIDLSKGLAGARALGIYGPTGFQPSESLKALVYFDDGDLRALSADEKSTLVQAASTVRDLPDGAVLSQTLAA